MDGYRDLAIAIWQRAWRDATSQAIRHESSDSYALPTEVERDEARDWIRSSPWAEALADLAGFDIEQVRLTLERYIAPRGRRRAVR